MKIYGQHVLVGFARKHAHARVSLLRWETTAKAARWATTAELKEELRAVSLLPGNLAIFNIKGNAYRLVVRLYLQRGLLQVLWIGSHAEYDRLDLRRLPGEEP